MMYQPSVIILPLLIIFAYQFLLWAWHRRTMVQAFVPQDILVQSEHSAAIKRMYGLGHRFDTKVLSIVLGVPLLVSSVVFYFTPHIVMGLAGVIFLFCLIVNGVIVGNFYYFKTYNNYYDIFMFGLAEDDTQAVLKNIYDDYPVIRLLIGVLISAMIPAIFCYYAVSAQWFAFSQVWLQVGLGFLTLLAMVFAMRGSIRSKPLGRGHAQVSSLSILNKMVPDGITAMSWAFSDRKSQISFDEATQEEGVLLLARLGDFSSLYDKTPKNDFLAAEKPHVVFTLMESFGQNFLIHDDEKSNDLLGRLRAYWQQGFVFNRFCSDYDGTAPSLASLFFHSPVQNISQSIAQNKALPETPFNVYKAQGYKTVFITAGNMMWRNLANYFPLQGVDALYDQNDLMTHFPEAKASLSYWGVADEYAFAMAEKLLKESEEPLFISILTMTNHPPYQVPSHYQASVLQPSVLEGRYGKNAQERQQILATYQYACDALGGFIQNVENHVLARPTVIAATGDHHVRGVTVNPSQELFLAKAVPFFVYIPHAWRDKLDISFDKHRIGSHKDIFPTLYALSLSEATYWHGCGRNLLGVVADSFAFAYNNNSVYATEQGVIDLVGQVGYRWQAEDWKLGESYTPTAEEWDKALAYKDFIRWQINYLVTQAAVR